MSEPASPLFIVYAETDEHKQPLIATDLTFQRLIDDIVLPYQQGDPFFIDGAAITLAKLRRIKILRAKSDFSAYFHDFHWHIRQGHFQIRELYVKQYHVRLEALVREGGEDVTSQVIKAFDSTIKPSIKDYLPKREELIASAWRFFFDGMRALGSSWGNG